MRRVAVIVVTGMLVAGSGLAMAVPTSANPLGELAGRWSGWGSISLDNGATEQMKCVATYFIKDGTSAIQQNLRCASASYKIDSTANLNVAGGKISGSWVEKTYSAEGSVNGKLNDSGMSLAIQGPSFSAVMAVNMSSCKQSINIAPKGFEIARISIGLGNGKCGAAEAGK